LSDFNVTLLTFSHFEDNKDTIQATVKVINFWIMI